MSVFHKITSGDVVNGMVTITPTKQIVNLSDHRFIPSGLAELVDPTGTTWGLTLEDRYDIGPSGWSE